jgi:arylsulfatase A-like enzyme
MSSIRRPWVVALVMALSAMVLPSLTYVRVSVAAAQRPSIVVVMIDDLPQMDDRVWSRLPTISHMFLENGVRFSDYVGNDPLCCPGRANALTGQFTDHTGVTYNNALLFDPRETIATELHRLGYWTVISGKYFSGTERLPDKTPPGWDRSLIYSYGYRPDTVMFRNGARVIPHEYTTRFIGEHAVRFMRAAPAQQPVFLWLAPYAVHAHDADGGGLAGKLPLVDDRYLGDGRCSGIAPWHPPGYEESDVRDKPSWVGKLPPDALWTRGWPQVANCEALLSVDDALRAVAIELRNSGRTDVVYVLTADNGMAYGRHRWPAKNVPYAVPIPLFFRATGNLGTGPVPRTETATVENVDLAPTICALAGCTMGPYPNGFDVDGISFLQVLQNQAPTLDRDWVYLEDRARAVPAWADTHPPLPQWHGVRSTDHNPLGRWEFTTYANGDCELYDLAADPWELRNLCNEGSFAAQQQEAQRALKGFRSER